jgi:PHD/YefM family antitoxin component YafN of YafNO toxin-antitoxin module
MLPYSVILTVSAPTDIAENLQLMTASRNHSTEIMHRLKDAKRAVIRTVNGKAAAAVQDTEAYRQFLDPAAQANAAESIRQGLEDLQSGRTRPNGIPR